MAITFQDCQSGTGGGGTTAPACGAFSVNPAANDLIVVGHGTWNNALAQTAPTDSGGNTYSQIGTTQRQNVTGGVAGMSMWYTKVVTGGSSFVVTGHVPASTNSGIIALLFRGIDTSAPYNGDWVGAIVTAGTPKTVGPTTPSPPANSIFVGFAFQDGGNVNIAASGGGGWTQPTNSSADRPAILRLQAAYQIASAAQTISWAGTSAFPFGGVLQTASWQPPAAAANTFPAPLLVV
jgi:hypothetical protein